MPFPAGVYTVLGGVSEARLTRVPMTATVTGIGQLPLALGSGQAGKK